MATLYVTEPGSRVEKEYRRLLVTLKDEVLMAVPLVQVSEVVLVGGTGITVPAMLSLLDHDVGLSLVNRSGRLRGRLQPAEMRNTALRRMQYQRAVQPDFCLEITRTIVNAKLANCRTFAMRILRKPALTRLPVYPKLRGSLQRLEDDLHKVREAQTIDRLRGFEGSGTRAYFSIFRAGLDEGFKFERRQRRPPRDAINAMLSLGYTLLTGAMITAAAIAGLDAYSGFFHAEKYGRPSLALDLIEEFRPIIVDPVVAALANKNMLREKDFNISTDGVFLEKKGLRVFFTQFTRRLNTVVRHPVSDHPLTYQKCFEVQARQMRKAIETQPSAYIPMLIR